MRPNPLPTIRWQHQSQPGEHCLQSLLIALLRALAALQVAAAHLRSEMFPGIKSLAEPPLYFQALAFATGFAHQAVVLFFLISGWLVGGSLLNRFSQPQALGAYALDRITRLWTVLLPTLALMLLAALAIGTVDGRHADFSAANEYSALAFAGNLFGLQTILVPNFGGNYALWSLANETWYYLLFPLLLVVLRGRGISRGACLAAIAILAMLLPFVIVLYFSLWLLGALFSRIRIDCGNGARWVLLAATAGASVYYRIKGSNDDLLPESFGQDLACSLPFLALLSTLQATIDPASRTLRRIGAIGKFFSEFSFTLYVLHVPTLDALQYIAHTVFGRDRLAPGAPLDLAIYLGMLAILLGVAWASYLLFESRTLALRRRLKRLLLGRDPAGTAVAG
jgi:peptidoglycan/LPS O-acetylase OafA/YrhL